MSNEERCRYCGETIYETIDGHDNCQAAWKRCREEAAAECIRRAFNPVTGAVLARVMRMLEPPNGT